MTLLATYDIYVAKNKSHVKVNPSHAANDTYVGKTKPCVIDD